MVHLTPEQLQIIRNYQETKFLQSLSNDVEEGFSMAPFGLHEVDTLDGWKLFSSDRLKNETVNIFQSSSLLSPVSKSIKQLFDKGLILTVYSSKNLFSHMGLKMFGSPTSRSILGFFTPIKNKVYLLMDNMNKLLSFRNQSEEISSLTMHELQHFCSYNLKLKFIAAHKMALDQYYRKMFDLFFDVKMSEKDVIKYYKYLLMNFELQKNMNKSSISKYAEFLDNLLEPYITNKKTRETKVEIFASTVHLYLTNPDQYIREVQMKGPSHQLFWSLWNSYKTLGIDDPKSLVIQETLYPSEVICIESQLATKSRHYAVIQMMAKS